MQQRDHARQGGALDAEQDARARSFVDAVPWRFARTVPEHPHWYALRAWLTHDHGPDFDWFAKLISRHGYRGRFWGKGVRIWTWGTASSTGSPARSTRRAGSSTEPAPTVDLNKLGAEQN
jgi:hypothetical protein